MRDDQRQPGVTGIWPHGNGVLTNFGEAAYLCVHAFARAVEAAGSVAAEALIGALEQVWVSGPQGVVEMDAATWLALDDRTLTWADAVAEHRVQASGIHADLSVLLG